MIVSIENIDKFEQKKNEKNKTIKNTWYDWLNNYVPEPIRKSVGSFNDKIVRLFKTNTPKQIVHGRGKN